MDSLRAVGYRFRVVVRVGTRGFSSSNPLSTTLITSIPGAFHTDHAIMPPSGRIHFNLACQFTTVVMAAGTTSGDEQLARKRVPSGATS